ncbi:WD domain, g-beta repeat domain-containing protein [Ditylenchus destructor]|nr:WD domain, g-beta repeat domain-containing protein [Ditylenchus destructor]
MDRLGELDNLDQATYDKLLQFLRKKGLTNTEKVLSKEAAGLLDHQDQSASTSDDLTSLSGEILSELGNLVEYIETTLSVQHRMELSVVLFPVFAHLYIQAVKKNQQTFARELFNRFHHSIPEFYAEQISQLKWVTTSAHIQTDLVDTLLTNTFLLKLSKPAMKLLEGLLARNPHIQDIVTDHITLETIDQPAGARFQATSANDFGGLLGQRSKTEKKLRMFYGIPREEFIFGPDKKKAKFKDAKDHKKKDASAPALDRIPLPSLPENVKQERRISMKDSQQKKTRISAENPPSVCLYTVLNANGGLCSASISENCAMIALGFGNSVVQVDSLASDELKMLKSAKELEKLDNDNDEFFDEMFESGDKTKSFKLYGHTGPVHSVSFSCERRLLLSGSRDSTMRLWNLEMRRNLVIYRTVSPVWQSQFCNRGYYFAASTADQTVSLWATDRTQPLRIFADSLADVTCLDFHPNCNYITGGSDDRYVRIWDVLTGSSVRTLSGHKGAIKSVKFSPCGRYLVSASADGEIAVWDLATHKMLGRQKCEPIDFNTPIAFSKDGTVFAMGTPLYGVSFYSMDAITHSSADESLNDLKVNPAGFSLFSYPTKRTSILDFYFTKRNTVVSVGVFNQ